MLARIIIIGALVWSAPAGALPVLPLSDPGGVTPVQNRLLPRIFGGEREQGPGGNNTATRLDQLESQVRHLTGQVEELTYTVRRLEAALGGAAPPADATQGPGAPPQVLGTLSGDPSQANAAPAAPAVPTAPAIPDAGPSGPIDLSVLNSTAPTVPGVATAPPTAPVGNDALSNVRQLHESGRYAMAEQEARQLLDENASGPVAGEARYLLGEALFAQGKYRDAANSFLENYTSDPNGSRAPASLLRLGTALNELGEREAACSSLDELFSAYPEIDGSLRAEAERERQAANCA